MGNSEQYGLSRQMKDYVVLLMEQDGRNFDKCEQCFINIPKGKYQIHHTKYEGATYYDLQIVCNNCNHKSENIGLA